MQSITPIELLSELTAHRAAYRIVLEALQSALSRFEKNSESLLYEAMVLKIAIVKGELLYLAGADVPADQQKLANAAFHRTFDSLSSEILDAVTTAFNR